MDLVKITDLVIITELVIIIDIVIITDLVKITDLALIIVDLFKDTKHFTQVTVEIASRTRSKQPLTDTTIDIFDDFQFPDFNDLCDDEEDVSWSNFMRWFH